MCLRGTETPWQIKLHGKEEGRLERGSDNRVTHGSPFRGALPDPWLSRMCNRGIRGD